MKPYIALASCIALAACMTPSSTPLPAGAVSFAQVLSDNAGRPYECADYDPATRSCAAVGRYRQAADGSLISEGLFLLSDTPRILARGTAPVRVINGRACTPSEALRFEIIEGAETPQAEFMLGFVEAVFADLGEVCATYTPSGDGYDVTSEASSTGPIPSTSRFFATAPALRADL